MTVVGMGKQTVHCSLTALLQNIRTRSGAGKLMSRKPDAQLHNSLTPHTKRLLQLQWSHLVLVAQLVPLDVARGGGGVGAADGLEQRHQRLHHLLRLPHGRRRGRTRARRRRRRVLSTPSIFYKEGLMKILPTQIP